MGENQFVLGSQRMELVFFRFKFLAGELGNSLRHSDIKALRSVQTGADSGATQCKFFQLGKRQFQKGSVTLQTAAPAGNFLGE